ncbi:hypothetical protein [Celerinatantimonas sp. YJH-8]|uniref:hypothetical protein n=1 Tax=Celerinatantimonas sp. YJH-8 TaxID=3228714 RepID=UPI0038C31562
MSKSSLPGIWNDLQLAGQLPGGPLWLLELQTSQVWFNYRDESGVFHQTSLTDWLYSLDASCRLAVRDTIQRIQVGHQPSLRCHFSHDDECWYRMNLCEMEFQGQLLLYGSITSLSLSATVRENFLPQTDTGALSCPNFRTLLIQALRANAVNGEPLTLMSMGIDPAAKISREMLASSLQKKMRRSDLMGMFRDQELLILLHGASPEVVPQIAEKLRSYAKDLATIPVENWLDIGWVYYPLQGDNVDTLLEKRYTQRLGEC